MITLEPGWTFMHNTLGETTRQFTEKLTNLTKEHEIVIVHVDIQSRGDGVKLANYIVAYRPAKQKQSA